MELKIKPITHTFKRGGAQIEAAQLCEPIWNEI